MIQSMKVRPVTVHMHHSLTLSTTLEVRAPYIAAELRNPICVYAYMVNGPEAAPSTMAAPNTQPTFSYDADRPFTRE